MYVCIYIYIYICVYIYIYTLLWVFLQMGLLAEYPQAISAAKAVRVGTGFCYHESVVDGWGVKPMNE